MSYSTIKRGIIALAACIFLTGSAFAQLQDTKKLIPPAETQAEDTDEGNQESDTHTDVAKKPPLLINFNIAGDWNINSEDTKNSANTGLSKWTDPINIITLFLVFVGICQGYWIYRTVIDSNHAKRAFIYVKNVHLERFYDVATKMFVGCGLSVEWQNSGETPTKHMLNHINLDSFDTELADTFEFLDYNAGNNIPILIGPKATMNTDVILINNDDIPLIIAGLKKLYVWGWADYNDVFHKTKRHRTEYCFRIYFGGDHTSDNFSIKYRFHGKYNGADDECRRPPGEYKRV